MADKPKDDSDSDAESLARLLCCHKGKCAMLEERHAKRGWRPGDCVAHHHKPKALEIIAAGWQRLEKPFSITMVAEKDGIHDARPLAEWHEDIGDVLWWRFPIEEPPYCGTPNDQGHPVEVDLRHYDGAGNVKKMKLKTTVGGWPGYHTHWTPLLLPMEPKK